MNTNHAKALGIGAAVMLLAAALAPAVQAQSITIGRGPSGGISVMPTPTYAVPTTSVYPGYAPETSYSRGYSGWTTPQPAYAPRYAQPRPAYTPGYAPTTGYAPTYPVPATQPNYTYSNGYTPVNNGYTQVQPGYYPGQPQTLLPSTTTTNRAVNAVQSVIAPQYSYQGYGYSAPLYSPFPR